MTVDSVADSERSTLSPPLRAILSLLVAVHFGAIAVNILADVSGPWPNLFGPGRGLGAPPPFIGDGLTQAARDYVDLVRLGENGRFPSNRWYDLQVQLDAVLFNEKGEEIAKRTLPDPNATPWIRAREQLLAQALANDLERPNPGNEAIPPAGQEPVKVPVWRLAKPDDTIQVLAYVPLHLLSREPGAPDWGPSDWGLLLSKSYATHLCRQTGAASVEIRRRWRYRILPSFIDEDGRPVSKQEAEQTLGERISSYGKMSDAGQR